MCQFVPHSAATSSGADQTENNDVYFKQNLTFYQCVPLVKLEKAHEPERVVSLILVPPPHHLPSKIEDILN